LTSKETTTTSVRAGTMVAANWSRRRRFASPVGVAGEVELAPQLAVDQDRRAERRPLVQLDQEGELTLVGIRVLACARPGAKVADDLVELGKSAIRQVSSVGRPDSVSVRSPTLTRTRTSPAGRSSTLTDPESASPTR